MKIIGKNFCYIQIEDLIYLLRNESGNYPVEIYKYLSSRDIDTMNTHDYVKLENPNWINYIRTRNSIFDFDFLASKTIEELNEFCDELASEMQKRSRLDRGNNSLVNLTKEKENARYYLSQIKQMITYKVNENEASNNLELK